MRRPRDVGEAFEWMRGRRLRRVFEQGGGSHVAFEFCDGGFVMLRAEGDCCSHSWIEHIETPADLEGATVLGVDELDTDSYEESDEYIQIYQTLVRTTAGTVAIEYRNSSNGYYGGYLMLEEFHAGADKECAA